MWGRFLPVSTAQMGKKNSFRHTLGLRLKGLTTLWYFQICPTKWQGRVELQNWKRCDAPVCPSVSMDDWWTSCIWRLLMCRDFERVTYPLCSCFEAAQNQSVFGSGLLLSAVITRCLIVQACVSWSVGGFPVSVKSQHDKNSRVFMNPLSWREAIKVPLGLS